MAFWRGSAMGKVAATPVNLSPMGTHIVILAVALRQSKRLRRASVT
jgi:hypothetical protein